MAFNELSVSILLLCTSHSTSIVIVLKYTCWITSNLSSKALPHVNLNSLTGYSELSVTQPQILWRRHGNPLQYSCLENPHGQRSLAGCSLWGHKESDTTDQLSTAHSTAQPQITLPGLWALSSVALAIPQSCFSSTTLNYRSKAIS